MRVKTFDATCGAVRPISIATFPETPGTKNSTFGRLIMTRKDMIEGGVFAAVLVAVLGAISVAAHGMAG